MKQFLLLILLIVLVLELAAQKENIYLILYDLKTPFDTVFSDNDIVSYDCKKHIFKLKEDAVKRIKNKIKVRHNYFMLTLNNEVVYQGYTCNAMESAYGYGPTLLYSGPLSSKKKKNVRKYICIHENSIKIWYNKKLLKEVMNTPKLIDYFERKGKCIYSKNYKRE